jgi:hypothetical protein
MHTGFWWEHLKERDDLRGPKPEWEDNIKMNLKEMEGDWTGFMCLKIEISG